jgi:hypothetical protein
MWRQASAGQDYLRNLLDKGSRPTLKGWNAAALTSSCAEGSTRTRGMPAATRYTSMMVCTGTTLAPASATKLRSSDMCRLRKEQNINDHSCHSKPREI